MIVKLVSVSMLLAFSGTARAQDASRPQAVAPASAPAAAKQDTTGFKSVAVSKAQYSQRIMHRCTVTPGAQWHAISTKGTGVSGRAAQTPAQEPIDLEFMLSPDAGGGAAATGMAARGPLRLSAKPQGTAAVGLSSGRSGVASVSCTGAAAQADDAARKAAGKEDAVLESRGIWDSRSQVWLTCKSTGSGKATRFELTLLVPAPAAGPERTHRVSIVPRGSDVAGASTAACSSAAPQSAHYDLAVLK
jgi:hypothetical protein